MRLGDGEGGGGGGGGERGRERERERCISWTWFDRWLQWSAMKHHEGQGSKMSLPAIARLHRQAE